MGDACDDEEALSDGSLSLLRERQTTGHPGLGGFATPSTMNPGTNSSST